MLVVVVNRAASVATIKEGGSQMIRNEKLTATALFRTVFLPLVATLSLFHYATPAFGSTKEPPSIATVVDSAGVATEVKRLEAVYSIGYDSPRYLKEFAQPELSVLLLCKKGHVSTSRLVEVPLSAIAVLRVQHEPTFRLTVEMKDKTLLVITSDTFAETASDGQSTKTTKIEKAKFVSTLGDSIEIQRSKYELSGFRGRAVTSAGEEGEFFLDFKSVKSITFH